MQTIINQTDKKIRKIIYAIAIFILIIIFRLFYLQIKENKKLLDLGERNFKRIIDISSLRGSIIDINGNILATNKPITNLYWKGSGNKELSKEQINVLKELEKILDINLFDDLELKKIKLSEKYSKSLLLYKDLSFDKISKISEKLITNNIDFETNFQRYYPNKSFASHIVGHLSQINPESSGKMGLEKIFEDILKGQNGKLLTKINSVGRKLSEVEIIPALSGDTIKTTLDLNIQKIAEEVFPENQKGAFIIIDPKDGALKAIVSRPSFDPTIFLKQLNIEEWKELENKKPFLNRAFCACYPPASIFKLVTISAALELGLVTEDKEWYCSGYTNFGNRTYLCNSIAGHGLISTKQAIAKSCNIPFYEIAKRLNINDLINYAKKFGLGEKTGLIFAEKEGLLPSSEWKLNVYGEKWWPGETLSTAIGQSYLLVTPIQIARMVSSIFEGELVKPRILQDEKIEKKPLKIKKEVLEFLKESMKTAVTIGTGQRVNKIKDITVYAKTGTAQTGSLDKKDMGEKFLEHAWFVSNFSFKDEDSLTMAIIIEHVGKTTLAVNTAKKFLTEYRQLMRNKEQDISTINIIN